VSTNLLIIAKNSNIKTMAMFVSGLIEESMQQLISNYSIWDDDRISSADQISFVRWMMDPGLTGRLEAFVLQDNDHHFFQKCASEAAQWLEYVRERWRRATDTPPWVGAIIRGINH